MERSNNLSLWVDTGYSLFAEEGLEGLQVERLARITGLNKSGFYHYFGNSDVYYEHLLQAHAITGQRFLAGLERAKNIDPDFIELLIEFKVAVMFQIRLLPIKNKASFQKVADEIHQRGDVIISKIWSDYLGIPYQPDLALRYFLIVRDMLYHRISFQNFNHAFLKNLFEEAKVVINQLADDRSVEA